MHHRFRIAGLIALTGLGMAAFSTLAADPPKCADIMKVPSQEASLKVDMKEADACQTLGWDDPDWSPNGGQNPGTKAVSSFSYGTTQAPESTPHARRAKASVNKKVILQACSFPPQVNISTSGVTLGGGSCYDFINGLLKDVNGQTHNGTTDGDIPIVSGACPAETDKTGLYGNKQPMGAGGSAALECGGMIPTTTYDLTLNRNPTGLITTENGAYYLWSYRKNGASFSEVGAGPIPLPRYLCKPDTTTVNGGMVKSVDLTPPIPQMIVYNANAGVVVIRLQSRESMPPGYTPPYDENEPEKTLVLPLDASGVPQVPADCEHEDLYYKVPPITEEIAIQSSINDGCDGFTNIAANTGASIPAQPACSGASSPMPDMSCDEYTALYKSCVVGSKAATPDTSCDTMTVSPNTTNTVCSGKSQYAVLNRPNLYYPPGTTANLYPIANRGGMMMAATAPGSLLFLQTQTIMRLNTTAPVTTFEEGGYIQMKDGSQLIMSPSATVNPATNVITLKGGGQLVTSGGSQKQGFNDGDSFTIPANLLLRPLEVQVGRSASIPEGYMIPTMPKVGTEAPYIRLPKDKPPT